MPPKPSAANKPPSQSSCWPWLPALLSGTFHRASNRTTSPSGRLMKNTHLHEPCSVNHPPSTGPMAAVIDVKPDHVPMARPRCSWEKLALIRARLPGTSSAPPIPWRPSGNDQLPDVGRQSAPGRGYGEEHDAGGEDLAAAVQVSQRPADEEQRRQEKRVRFHNPLNVR